MSGFRYKKLLYITLLGFAITAQAQSAYDKGIYAGEHNPIAKGLTLTKAQWIETAEVQAYHAVRGGIIKEKDSNRFVAGWIKGFLTMHPHAIQN